MSVVWQADDSLTKSPVAIKLFRFPPEIDDSGKRELLSRCRREVLAASRINHPNVVRVFGAEEAQEGFYIVMELVRGVSMREKLRMEGKFDPANAAQVATQLCDALAAAHALGIVHCDLKPENVLLEAAGPLKENAKLVDFGVAQAARRPGEMLGAWGGSPAYMSPEQIMGRPVDGRSDIFSLGVVLFEMLLGRPAFAGETIMAVVHKVVNEPLEVGHLPRPFGEIVAKATEKRRLVRSRSALEIREALRMAFPSLQARP